MRVEGPQFDSDKGEIPDRVKGPGKYIASHRRSEASGEFEDTSYRPAAGRLFTGFPDELMLMAVHAWPASLLGKYSSHRSTTVSSAISPPIETLVRMETAVVILESVDIISDCGSMTLN